MEAFVGLDTAREMLVFMLVNQRMLILTGLVSTDVRPTGCSDTSSVMHTNCSGVVLLAASSDHVPRSAGIWMPTGMAAVFGKPVNVHHVSFPELPLAKQRVRCL